MAARWIPASRPPTGHLDVLVVHAGLPRVGYLLPTAFLRKLGAWWYVHGHGATQDITHWQPLPRPPRKRRAG